MNPGAKAGTELSHQGLELLADPVRPSFGTRVVIVVRGDMDVRDGSAVPALVTACRMHIEHPCSVVDLLGKLRLKRLVWRLRQRFQMEIE